MNKTQHLVATVVAMMGSAALTNGVLLAAPAVVDPAPVVVAQNENTPVVPPATTNDIQNTPSSTPAPDSSVTPVTQPAYSSGAVSPVASDYYKPQAQAEGLGFTKLPFRFGLTLGLIGDDNINISSNNKQSDFLQVLTPSLTFETSRLDDGHPFYAGVTFDPTLAFYDSHSEYNYTDWHVHADAQYKWSQLLMGVSQSYDTYNGANIQFGGRLSTQVYNTRLYASAPITEKINWDIEGIQKITRYDQGYDNNEWLADTYFDYAIFPKVRLGAGGEFGFLNFVDGYQTNGGQVPKQPKNSDQTYQQGNLRLIYNYSDKLKFTGKLGGETRQYDNGGSTATPVMDFGAIWSPFVHTTIQFDAFRRTVAAIAQHNTDYNYTGVDLLLSQGFLHNFKANLGLGYNNSKYNNVVPTQTYSGLTYNYYTVRPSVDWTPNKHFTGSVYYQYQNNNSTLSGSGFNDNQFGLSGSIAY